MKEIPEALGAYSLDLYPLRGNYAEKTLEFPFENGVTVYDASYIALAITRSTHI